MNRHVLKSFRLLLGLSLITIAGCKTPPTEDRPLTLNEQKALLAQAKNPRSLYLTVFEGPVGPEFENAHRLHQGQFSQLKMFDAKEQPGAIRVKGGTSAILNAVLDPSTPESWAPVSMKSQAPLTPMGPPYYEIQAAHLANADVGFLTFASIIKLDSLFVNSALFAIRNHTGDLGPFGRGIVPTPDLVLGHDFMKQFHFIQFDYPGKMMTFATSKEYPVPDQKRLASIPLLLINGALGTEATINGQKTRALLDLAGNYGIALPEPQENPHVYLEDLALRGLTVTTPEILGLTDNETVRIGWQALRTFVITLDYHRKRIWIERP